MKKLQLLFSILLVISFTTSAQDLQSVQGFIAVNDYKSARLELDSFLHDKKNRQEPAPWFYKGKIYTEVVRRYDTLNARMLHEALEAYKRYQELDAQNTMMALDNNVGLFQLYDLSYSNGVNHYNKENYGHAYLFFRNALETEEYITKKKFAFNGNQFPALDTQLISLTAFSAYLSNNEEEAIPYFSRLADLKLNSSEFKGVYTLLYKYYQRKNDGVKAARYLTTARQVFDDEDYWIRLELGSPKNPADRFARYEQMLLKYPSNFTLVKNYGIDLFNYVYGNEKPADLAQKQQKLQQVLTRLTRLDDSSAFAHYIMSQHIQNSLYDLEENYSQLEGEGPAADNKRKALDNRINRHYEDLLVHSLRSYQLYASPRQKEPANKENMKKLLEQLVNCYQRKKEAERVEFYQARLGEL